MLVISRYDKEEVWLLAPGGVPIKVAVLDVTRGKVRLGFEADTAVTIHRREVWEAIAESPDPSRPRWPGFIDPTPTPEA